MKNSGYAFICYALAVIFMLVIQVDMIQTVDECEAGLIKCSDNALCKDIDTNINGTANCTCKEGYTGNGSSCDDIDECEGETHCPLGTLCTNVLGSYQCTRQDKVWWYEHCPHPTEDEDKYELPERLVTISFWMLIGSMVLFFLALFYLYKVAPSSYKLFKLVTV
ncbi:uromodulin-like [Xenia sp. Carnegie-2017]|uniref:uromodulin-like n=1 Tax=Xenia sp. Carnegie-2017 TaxID=2897299 RepID=UPI001F033E69|nr:uromodulin-like [Xenia sp. Carnegie-2017]